MVLVPPIEVAHTVDEEIDILVVCSHILPRDNVGIDDDIETEFVA